MLTVLPPSFVLPGKVLLQGMEEPEYQLLVMHLNQMLTQLDRGLEDEGALDLFLHLALDFLLSFEKRKPEGIEIEALDEHAYLIYFPTGEHIYLNVQHPHDRMRMLNSSSIEKPSFYETAIQSLKALFQHQQNIPSHNFPSTFLITNLYEWYIFFPKDFFKVFGQSEELLTYYTGWKADKPGYRSLASLQRAIDRSIESQEIPCTYFNLYGIKEGLSKSWESIQERLIPIGLFLQQILGTWHSSTVSEPLLQKEFAYLMGIEKVYKKARPYYQSMKPDKDKSPGEIRAERRNMALYIQRMVVEEFLDGEQMYLLEKKGFWDKTLRKKQKPSALQPYPGGLISSPSDSSLPFEGYLSKVFHSVSFEKHVRLRIHKSGKLPLYPGTWSEMWTNLAREAPNSYHLPPLYFGKIIQQKLKQLIIRLFEKRLDQLFPSWEMLKKHLREFPKKETRNLLFSIKICDPSAGTGDFLELVLHELVIIFGDLNCLSEKAEKSLEDLRLMHTEIGLYPVNAQGIPIPYPTANQGGSQPAEERRIHEALFQVKLQIINKCLYGITSSPFYAQVVKNRLLLSLLSNYYQYSGKQHFKWIGLRALHPNIYEGNALLSPIPLQAYTEDPANENLLPSDPRKTRLLNLRSQYQKSLQPLSLWDTASQEVNTSHNPAESPSKQELLLKEIAALEQQLQDPSDFWKLYIHWKSLFPFLWNASGKFQGFDWIGSSPPSIRQESFKSFNSYLKDRYSTYDSQSNYAIYLMELAVRILRPGGQFLFLCPEKVYKAQYAASFRTWMQENTLLSFQNLTPDSPSERYLKGALLISGAKNMPVEKIGE